MSIFRLDVEQELFNNTIFNVYHIGTEAAGTLVQAQETAEAMIAEVYGAILAPKLVNNWRFTGNYWLTNVSLPGQPRIPFVMAPYVGDSVLDPLPTQTAGLVTWRAYTAKPNKAHKFYSGWSTDAMGADGRFVPGVAEALDEIGDVIINSQPIGGFLPFVTVRYYPNSTEVHMANQLTHATASSIPTDRSTRKMGRGQ